MKKFIILTMLLCSAALCGCAMQDDVIALNERIYMLEQHNAELEQRNESALRENAQIRSRLEDFSKNREEKDQTLRNQSAGLQATFEKINEDIRTLNGKIEEVDHLLKKTVQTFQTSEKNKEMRLSRLEKYINFNAPVYESANRSAPTPPPDPAGTAPAAGAGESGGKSEQELYDAGKQTLDQDDFENARKLFQMLLTQYPQSQHADNAQFWIGETYYRQRLYEQAILEYQTVIEKYPYGNKVKAALLKQGFSFFNIGDKTNSRVILQELVNKYPDSEEAKIAKSKLEGF